MKNGKCGGNIENSVTSTGVWFKTRFPAFGSLSAWYKHYYTTIL